jgi:hypothetical protein
LHRRFGHVLIYSRNVRSQAGCDARRHGQGGLEPGEDVGHGEEDVAHLQILPLGQWGLDDGAEEVTYAGEVVQLFKSE